MGRYSGKTCRLMTMLSLTSTFFLVEIIVGYITNSTALVADSFHMLSDVVAIIVGFASVRISKWPSKRNTYGWVRAEILGALVNAVFLLALCFSIIVEALKRLVKVEIVERPELLLVVGGAGLFVNVIGLLLFWSHGHSHGGHGHSHGGHGHSHGGHSHSHVSHGDSFDHEHASEKTGKAYKDTENGNVANTTEKVSLVRSEDISTDTILSDDKEIYVSPGANITIEIKEPKLVSSNWMNMKGVFLHVLGDALGSVVVVISALIIWFADGDWRFYVDPSLSIIMVIIILITTIPLLKESAFILLQTVPSHVNVENIVKELEQMDGIYGVHECHIWQLAGNRIVASAHIRCHGIEEYMTLAAKIKKLFHKAGIHSTTIQPEFIDWRDRHAEHQPCVLLCDVVGEQCKSDTCCGDRSNHLSKRSSNTTKVTETVEGRSVKRSFNMNNSNHHKHGKQKTFPSLRSLDMKFSPDGDEVVLEVSEIMTVVIEASDESGSIENIHSSEASSILLMSRI